MCWGAFSFLAYCQYTSTCVIKGLTPSWGFILYFFVLASRPNYRSQICFLAAYQSEQTRVVFYSLYRTAEAWRRLLTYRVILSVNPSRKHVSIIFRLRCPVAVLVSKVYFTGFISTASGVARCDHFASLIDEGGKLIVHGANC